MNRYDSYLQSMSPEEWELFASDFLSFLGWEIVSIPSRGADAGKDLIVSFNSSRFLVSCKHFIHSNQSVGVSDEDQLLERMMQHQCIGFLGFYSTIISSSLLTRLESFKQNNPLLPNFTFHIFDKSIITEIIPSMNIRTLSKYGFTQGFMFPFNVEKENYIPLNCLFCGKDILESDNNINCSTSTLIININNEIEYVYGCKTCCSYEQYFGSIELSQALHSEQLLMWNRHLMEIEQKPEPHKLSINYFENKSKFQNCILQRTFPADWASFL